MPYHFGGGTPFGAVVAPAVRVLLVRSDADHLVPLDGDLKATPRLTDSTEREDGVSHTGPHRYHGARVQRSRSRRRS